MNTTTITPYTQAVERLRDALLAEVHPIAPFDEATERESYVRERQADGLFRIAAALAKFSDEVMVYASEGVVRYGLIYDAARSIGDAFDPVIEKFEDRAEECRLPRDVEAE